MKGDLPKPFRYFSKASLRFATNHPSGGKHLDWICLKSDSDAVLPTMEDNFAEVEAIVAMLEKKFGIKFTKSLEKRDKTLMLCLLGYEWTTPDGDESIWQHMDVLFNGGEGFSLSLSSNLLSKKDEEKLQNQKKSPKLAPDAGANQL